MRWWWIRSRRHSSCWLQANKKLTSASWWICGGYLCKALEIATPWELVSKLKIVIECIWCISLKSETATRSTRVWGCTISMVTCIVQIRLQFCQTHIWVYNTPLCWQVGYVLCWDQAWASPIYTTCRKRSRGWGVQKKSINQSSCCQGKISEKQKQCGDKKDYLCKTKVVGEILYQ